MSTASGHTLQSTQSGYHSTASQLTYPAGLSALVPRRLNPIVSRPTANVIRRANPQQGRALEILGRAVEYLVDSRMFLIHEPSTPADSQAIQILMRLSRQVFAECAESVSPADRLRRWIDQRLKSPAGC